MIGNVYKLERNDIVNLDVLTKKKQDRVCLIRPVNKTFQQAAIIVLRQSFMNGYILKETFETADANATLIDVRLPSDLTNDVELNFGSMELKRKYPHQIKLKKKKLSDLQKMVPAIYPNGDWIAILVGQQEHAIEYEEDADEGYFVTSMELNNETPIRINASEQSGEQ